MKLKKLVAFAAVAMAASAAAHATPTLTNLDGAFDPFGGFDWASNGAAYVTGFGLSSASAAGSSDAFTLYYMAAARDDGILDTSGTAFATPGNNVTYEYTVFATLNETATCTGIGGTLANPCGALALTATSGTWDIYYDTAPNADIAAGTGFRNGISILSGVFNPGFAGFFVATGDAPNGSGSGSNTLTGTVLITDNTYINPDLVGTTAVTTLQYGAFQTGFVRPATFDGVGGYPGADSGTDFVFQADSNQDFTIPEPGSMALIGLGLIGLGLKRRSKT